MTIVERVQDEIKKAMKNREQMRLDCLRMVKGALLLKEKETGQDVTDEQAVPVLRSEVRKRQDTVELLTEHGKLAEAEAARQEIAIIEEFLPRQLSAEELEARVRAYLAEHPETNNPGKLTGAMKKELGDLADGKILNDVCRKVLNG